MYSHYDMQEENAAYIKEIREDIRHLSASLDGILKKVQKLENYHTKQEDVNGRLATCIEILADELELEITEVPSAES